MIYGYLYSVANLPEQPYVVKYRDVDEKITYTADLEGLLLDGGSVYRSQFILPPATKRPRVSEEDGAVVILINEVVLWLVIETIKAILLHVFTGDKITVSEDDLREKASSWGRVLQEERRIKQGNSGHKILLVWDRDKITVPKYDLGEKAPKERDLQEERRTKQDYSSHKILLVGEGDKIRVPKYDLGEKAPKGRVLEEEKRIKHYCNNHKILLVGEGDFSFSACLAKVFGSASNMVATSLNSKGFVEENYGNAISNINDLKSRRCVVLHGVDATKMARHKFLKGMRFDRIVFNFPYAGFHKNDSRKPQTSGHQKLISEFFKNAKKMLSEEGEIHVSQKSKLFNSKWNIESLASLSDLNFLKAVKFSLSDYPGYNIKKGFGGDRNFNCKRLKTYMFGRETKRKYVSDL
ncbi:hypothetical protein NE237_028943 [Protea cynaroides]|uniref:25S rRNA (uridine-N(3))-methyltransferase BMT5-like domain-containing protein n=1 Tax=Protea cynaroides TaxID=273540 RepID=A0A9Q0JUB2_9MAGN|nr:hypothetical protein NE237_028943 [Protea cynaroides]